MAFTTSGQETEWALFLQPRTPHGAIMAGESIDLILCFTLLAYVSDKIKDDGSRSTV